MRVDANLDAIVRARAALRAAGEGLRRLRLEERAAVIARAASTLADPGSELGRELRTELARTSGLSLPVIEYGLTSTLGVFERDALVRLAGTERDEGVGLAVAVLAGNVFSAAARPLFLPLLCASPVLAKAASADDALPRSIERALAAADSRLGAACGVVSFARERDADARLTHALCAEADVLSIYGDDASVAALSGLAPEAARVLAHGHGWSAIYIAGDALASEAQARALASAAALDIAAYDQRGCLSPHAVLVQAGDAADARAFARLLAQALAELERSLPRGALALEAAAAQLAWRGVSAALFEFDGGPSHALSYEDGAPLRASPGYRNVSVYACRDLAELGQRLAPLGAQLKALGVAGLSARRALEHAAPYVCELGAMQTPPLAARLDGLHPLAGFRRR